jgi:Ca2+-binding RTX toxin-like protein
MTTTPQQWLPATTVLDTNASDQRAQVIQLSNGNSLVVWQSDTTLGGGNTPDQDIMGQIYDPAGGPLGDLFRLNTLRSSDAEMSPRVSALPGGGFTLTYIDHALRQDAEGGFTWEYDVIVESFDNDGTLRESILVADGNPGPDFNFLQTPDIAALSDTRALVIWEKAEEDLRGRIINPTTGGTVVATFDIFDGAPDEAIKGHAVAALPGSNQYAVAFADGEPGANDDKLSLKLISASGVVGATTVLESANVVSDPAIAVLTNGRFVVGWTRDGSGGTDSGVRLQVVNADGTLRGGLLTPATNLTGNQREVALAATDGGGFVAFWFDDSRSSIAGQRYAANGSKVGGEFLAHIYGTEEITDITATRLADGRVQLAWTVDDSSADDTVEMAIWDPRDTHNAPDQSGIVAGTRGNDVIDVVAGTKQVFAGKGADSIVLDLSDIAGLTTLNGGEGDDEIRFAAQAGTFDLRPVWVAYTEELEFAGGLNLARTVRAEALDVAFLGEIDFDLGAGTTEKVIIDMGSQTTLNLENLVMTDQQAGLDSLVIKGDRSLETITGSDGHDTIEGGRGNDVLAGRGGNDTVEGQVGADSMTGGRGQDTVSYAGAAGAVTVNLASQTASGGDAAGDTISGFEHANGGTGNDALFGSTAANTLRGNGGDDVLDGAEGADSIDGGAGNDMFWIDDGDIVAGDILYGGSGTGDRLHVLANGGGAGLTTTDLRPAAIAGMERITFANTLGDSLLRINRYQMDTIAVIEGFAGLGIDETLEVFSSVDTVVNLSALTFAGWDAAANLVKLIGDADSESLTGTSQRDSIGGGDGNDTLTGGAGNDTLNASLGNDTLTGGAGADSLQGGAGTDTADYSAVSGVTVDLTAGTASGGDATGDTLGGIENVIGSAGSDAIYGVSDGSGPDHVLYGGSGGNDTLHGGSGNDRLYSGGGNDTLAGGDGNDRLYSGGGNDILDGGAHDDTLDGGSGNDQLSGNTGNDTLTGGAGADSLDGGDGTDTADYSGAGAAVTVRLSGPSDRGDANGDTFSSIERVVGSAFDDGIVGTAAGAETLDGRAGHDNLYSGAGDDTLIGGTGNDTLYSGAGADSLEGGEGTDTASFSNAGAAVTVRLAGVSDRGDANGDTFSSIERVVGSGFDDGIVGSADNDTIEGGDGADNIYGEVGNDTLIGDGGNDTFYGRIGDDTLTGGAGADRFVFGLAYDTETVTDFTDGSDLVDLIDGLTFTDLTETAIAGGVRLAITADPATWIDLIGVNTGQIDGGDFI